MRQARNTIRRTGDPRDRLQQGTDIQRLTQIRGGTLANTLLAHTRRVMGRDDDDGKVRARRNERFLHLYAGKAGHLQIEHQQSGRSKCQEFKNSVPEAKPRAQNPAARSTRSTAFRTESSSSTTAITGRSPIQRASLLRSFEPIRCWTLGLLPVQGSRVGTYRRFDRHSDARCELHQLRDRMRAHL